METWSELCRCCLSENTKVSLLDTEQNIHSKFLETTSIEVKQGDGLPQKLCENCLSLMNSAYIFKKQCMRMDQELKQQLDSLFSKANFTLMKNTKENIKEQNKCDISSDPLKQLQSIIKQEQIDSDDDCYYVLVIDSPEEKKEMVISQEPVVPIIDTSDIKTESLGEPLVENNPVEPETNYETKEIEKKLQEHSFVNNIDSYLVSTEKIPDSVPATILENEEESTLDNEEFSQILNEYSQTNAANDGANGNGPHDASINTIGTANNITKGNANNVGNSNMNGEVNCNEIANKNQGGTNDIFATQVTSASGIIEQDINDINTNSFIKILTTSGPDGALVLKTDNIGYLPNTDGTVATANQLDPQVIFCQGDASQFQILKCDGSELVIEYTEGSEIATVLQQADGSLLCECGEKFPDIPQYENHQHKHNPAGDHLCNLCGKDFESAEILTGHILLHKATGQHISCPYCDQVVKRHTLTHHIKYNHNNIKPCCKICSKTFANPNNLKRHMMIHKGIKEFECDICFKRFHQKITMQTHRLTHLNITSCKECDLSFQNKAELTNHKYSGLCTKSKLLKVKEEYMKNIKQEITASVGGKLLGYACSLCKKMFSLESALEEHVNAAHVIDPADLLCSNCGEVFATKKEMQAHMTSHKAVKARNAKKFECSTCQKGCSSHAMLIMHERVHTNERPFACHLCSLRFKTKTHLRTHQLTHTREKRFGCSVCMKFFALKGNLVVHLRTHTGERPYVCSICTESFIDSKYLKKHKSKRHAIENVPWNKY